MMKCKKQKRFGGGIQNAFPFLQVNGVLAHPGYKNVSLSRKCCARSMNKNGGVLYIQVATFVLAKAEPEFGCLLKHTLC